MKRYVSAFGILKVEESMEKLNSEIIADCALWPLWSPDNILLQLLQSDTEFKTSQLSSPFIVEVS
jgi:hypothetical protein